MKVIGLTGGTGSGKSVVSAWLKDRGAVIIDADAVAHGIIEKGKPAYFEIVDYYGKEILDNSGHIVRKALGNIVFKDKNKLEFLNRCTHKYINHEINSQMEQAKAEKSGRCIILDAPLLFEAGLQEKCDTIWAVVAEEQVRIQRIMMRDGLSYQQALERIAAQKSRAEYEALANVVIDNSGDLASLEQKLKRLLPCIKK